VLSRSYHPFPSAALPHPTSISAICDICGDAFLLHPFFYNGIWPLKPKTLCIPPLDYRSVHAPKLPSLHLYLRTGIIKTIRLALVYLAPVPYLNHSSSGKASRERVGLQDGNIIWIIPPRFPSGFSKFNKLAHYDHDDISRSGKDDFKSRSRDQHCARNRGN
jgi:hypothetical protein